LKLSDPVRRKSSFVFTIAGFQGVYCKIISDPVRKGVIRILHVPDGKIGVVVISVHPDLAFQRQIFPARGDIRKIKGMVLA
jgi:hypothetical protein